MMKHTDKNEILDIIKKSNYIAIIGHRNPDVDCIASCLGLSFLIKNVFNKEATVINTDKKSIFLDNVLHIDKVLFEVDYDSLPKKDLLIVLDSGDIDRIGFIADILDEYNDVIFIDHHKCRNLKGVTKFFNNTRSAATCEMIFDIFEDYIEKIDSTISTLLYSGMMTDTGSFSFSNTTEHTLYVAYKLMSCNVDMSLISNIVRKRYRKIDIDALSELYSRIVIDDSTNIGYICVEETLNGYDLKDLQVSVSDTLMQMNNVHIGFIIYESENSFRGSIRSRCEKDIREVAEHFGGGGHLKASGFTVSKNDYDKDTLVSEIINRLKSI